jgi:transposase
MTPEQEIAQLKAENQALREQLASRDALLAQLVERVQALQARLAQDSHNSSKPPSSDGFKRSPKKRSLRNQSGKKPGGQTGHPGQALCQVQADQVDRFVSHRPTACEQCQHNLADQPVLEGFEPRQVFELPPPYRLHVTEHQSYTIKCPQCCHCTKAAFPASVTNWVQYGAAFRAVAVYLVCYQLLPYQRACELLNQLYSTTLSPGTLQSMVEQAYHLLEEPEKRIVQSLSQAQLLHCDETGLSIEGKRLWLHVAATSQLTHYAYHPKRGSQATEAIGILPGYTGTLVHDGWKAYNRYECQHALCNAHHLRELSFVSEQLGQSWAGEFKTLLIELKTAVETAKAKGATALSREYLASYEKEYQKLIEAGLAANPPPANGWSRGKRGRAKQTKPLNLLARLAEQRARVLLFAYRFEVPFDNNQAERDIRQAFVQQKISGTFRSQAGASYWCRIRGYLSTMQKQGQNLLLALLATFRSNPPLPSFGV